MLGDWRKNLESAKATGEWLERVAQHLGIVDLPFVIDPYENGRPYLDWCE